MLERRWADVLFDHDLAIHIAQEINFLGGHKARVGRRRAGPTPQSDLFDRFVAAAKTWVGLGVFACNLQQMAVVAAE